MSLFQWTASATRINLLPQLAVWPPPQFLEKQDNDSHFKKWLGWCSQWNLDPIPGPDSVVANFLANLHSQGYQTNSLNAYRSAISNVHDRVDDMDVGKHLLVARVLKGVFHARPPLPH